jgi:hypothetical protein
VLHGDVFDTVTKNFVFLAHLGDWGYRALLGSTAPTTPGAAGAGSNTGRSARPSRPGVKSAVSHVGHIPTRFEDHIADWVESPAIPRAAPA